MDKISFPWNSQPKWPEAASIAGTFRGVVKGKYKCWEVRDRDEEPFKTILGRVCDELEQSIGRVPSSCLIGYDIFMIGNTPEVSVPHIMFHCSRNGPRKDAVNHIKRSGLLKEYKGLGVGQWISPPHLPNISLAAGSHIDDFDGPSLEYHLISPLENSDDIGFSDTKPLRLLVMRHAGQSSSKATVALTTRFGGETCILAPAHAFLENECGSGNPSDDDDNDFEFSAFNDEDTAPAENGGLDHSSILSRGSQSPDIEQFLTFEDCSDVGKSYLQGNAHSWSSNSSSSAAFYNISWSPRIPPLVSQIRHNEEFDGCTLACIPMDYVLIPTQLESIAFFNLTELCESTVGYLTEKEVEIFTEYTTGLTVKGVLYNRPSYMQFPSASTFQKVYPVNLEGTLKLGDCGAAVRSLASRMIIGHIVAGSFDTGVAFIVLYSDILASIRDHERHMTQQSIRKSEEPIHLADNLEMDLKWDQYEKGSDGAFKKSTVEQSFLSSAVMNAEANEGDDDDNDDDDSDDDDESLHDEYENFSHGLGVPGYFYQKSKRNEDVEWKEMEFEGNTAASEASFNLSIHSIDSGYHSAQSMSKSASHSTYNLSHKNAPLDWHGGEDDMEDVLAEYWFSAETTAGEGPQLTTAADPSNSVTQSVSPDTLKDLPSWSTAFKIHRFLNPDSTVHQEQQQSVHAGPFRHIRNRIISSVSKMAGYAPVSGEVIEEDDDEDP